MKKVTAILLAGTLSIGTIGTSAVVFAENNTNTTTDSQEVSIDLSALLSGLANGEEGSTDLNGLLSGIANGEEGSIDMNALISGIAGNLDSLTAMFAAFGYDEETNTIDVNDMMKAFGMTKEDLDKAMDEAEKTALEEAGDKADEAKAMIDELRKEIEEGTIKLDDLYDMLSEEEKQSVDELINGIMYGALFENGQTAEN